MRLDLPTFERPTKAISSPRVAGSEATEPAAETKRHSDANILRPAAISPVANARAAIPLCLRPGHSCPDYFFFFEQALDAPSDILEIVPQFDLRAVPMHDDGLLNDR